ncbi:FeoB-associated Cys-rich membrane protein [Halarcobacter bivalviorum]|nr:FeoB-associated Cys-rich membrane protein [Halarcobacter bivalviorum]RXK07851.1 FeoB-associated Cys-rich membrane protein [Halarcobacter bivalviorum]
MENLFIIIIALLAAFYLFNKIFKNSGCNCGSKDCGTKKK